MRKVILTLWVVLCVAGGVVYSLRDKVPKDTLKLRYDSEAKPGEDSVFIAVKKEEGKKTVVRVPKSDGKQPQTVIIEERAVPSPGTRPHVPAVPAVPEKIKKVEKTKISKKVKAVTQIDQD